MSNWNNIDIDPPNKKIEVKTEDGNVYKAFPCYYPFRIINGKVEHCEEYFDNSFVVELPNLEAKIAKIVAWMLTE